MDDLLERAKGLVLREGWLLDHQDWDTWLELYVPDAEFWLPCWKENEELTTDPLREISLIYYATRSGLEDRVFRIKTGRSLASAPLPRTTHMTSIIQATRLPDDTIQVDSNWVVFSYRLDEEFKFFGHQRHLFRHTADGPKIAKRKIVLMNDTIHCPLDIYSI